MAAKRPSYLKRLKEQKRNAHALEKRDAREARKRAKPLLGTAESQSLKRSKLRRARTNRKLAPRFFA